MKTASSSSPSPPLPRPKTTTSETRTTPAIIKLDYNYTTMSPSSSRTHQLYRHHSRSSAPDQREVDVAIDAPDSQYSSLFGDPVPPPPPAAEEFFRSQFSDATNFLHRASIEVSSEEEAFGERTNVQRLFSETPYSSSISHRLSNVTTAAPHLQPPDIQILPNSSGGSSSEPMDSPNFALLMPNDIALRPGLYDIVEPTDTSELLETMTISDATGRREYSEVTRRASNFSEDFKSNVGSLGTPPPDVPELPKAYTRQFSNESYSSSEWFRPATHDFPEFSKMPRLRPSSKNVMSIKRDEMPMHQSPVAAMINDSNGSSSGEERLLDTTVVLEHPTVPLPDFQSPESQSGYSPNYRSEFGMDLLLSPRAYLQQRRKSTIDSKGPSFPLPLALPPSQIAPPPTLEKLSELEETEMKSLKRELSPVITTDSVAMGGENRVDQARLHKKTSFTIISDKSPQSSRTQSPVSFHHKSQISPFLGYGFRDTSSTTTKPIAKPRQHLQRKSLSSTQLKLPLLKPNLITSDDSPRPSVQFNMTARHSPSKMPQKGILQYRESFSSSLDQDHPLPPKDRYPPNALPSSALAYVPKMNSCETLPLITDPYRTAIPRLNRSSLDLRRESVVIPPGALPRSLKPSLNPTRKQRGLLRVINSADSLSRIPLRSYWASMDDISIGNNRRPTLTPLSVKVRRRSSSTSPERRSSTQTVSDRRSSNLSSVTTSDFSFRRSSMTPQPNRRKSLFATNSANMQRRQSVAPSVSAVKTPRTPRNKIAKPSTLSPIIGTPNKDSSTPQSPTTPIPFVPSDSASGSISRRDSLSKIPVRSAVNSRSNSRLSSHASSRRNSRSNSPVKDLADLHLNLSGLTSRATSSRTPSRATVRSESQQSSRANSKAPSRSTSRASTKPLSRGPSRASSRPTSRMEQAKNVADSRSNSRLSQRSAARASSFSPLPGHKKSTPFDRRKSVSLSPKAKRRIPARRGSTSPNNNQKATRSKKTPVQQRRNSRSRIPKRANNDLQSASQSPVKTKNLATNGLRKKSPSKVSNIRQKEPSSAKKAPTAVQKPASSVKRTPSSVKKQSVSTKKQTSKIQKTEGKLRREVSNVQRKATVISTTKAQSVKREASSVSLKKADTDGLKRQGSTLSAKIVAKKITESKKASSNKDEAKSNEATSKDTAPTSNAAVGKTFDKKGLLKRQASKLSLMRMGSNLSLLSKKRPDSSLSKKIEEIPIGEETELKGQSGETSGDNDETINATYTALSTQESTQKLQDALSKNGHQKVMEGEAIRTGYESTASPTPSMATVVENKGGKGESASRSGTAEGTHAAVKSPAENSVAERASSKSPAPPTQPVEAAVSVINASHVSGTNGSRIAASPQQLAMGENAELAERVSERAISVLPEVESESANFQNSELGFKDKTDVAGGKGDGVSDVNAAVPMIGNEQTSGYGEEFKTDSKRRSPDGQGGSASGSGGKTGSQEHLKGKENEEAKSKRGCCSCCTKLCMPCRRSRCSRCCKRKKPLTTTNNNNDEAERPVLTPPSSASTATNLEVIDEKKSCWKKLNCCKRKKKPQSAIEGEIVASREQKMETIHEETTPQSTAPQKGPPKQSKCGLCLSKVFCCRSVNKVKTSTEGVGAAEVPHEKDVRKCCFCIPCRRKRQSRDSAVGSIGSSVAWQDPERGVTATDASVLEGVEGAATKQGCCKLFWGKCLCCRKKAVPVVSESRRASIKQAPPVEDTRRKLHVDLIEYNSKMKGAIPVMPLYLAWFCAICNTVFPGLGTLFSGLFCICVGIPRFSQYDSAKARFGSLIINIIVAVSQFFCVLFCFVGWGWSIWWGTIMLKCARKLSKIKKVERLEMEDERRQAEQEAAAAAATAAAAAAVTATRAAIHPTETAATKA